MNRHHLNRLLKLANHLRYGKLGHDEFDFGQYNSADDKASINKIPGCGTAGCAMGENPIIFKQWVFMVSPGGFFMPALRGEELNARDLVQTEKSGKSFFGISDREYGRLFLPGDRALFSGGELGGSATKNEVSANIRAFVKIKCREHGIPYSSLVNKRK